MTSQIDMTELSKHLLSVVRHCEHREAIHDGKWDQQPMDRHAIPRSGDGSLILAMTEGNPRGMTDFP
jgi:hypothetical protein